MNRNKFIVEILDVSILGSSQVSASYLLKSNNCNILFDCGPESQFKRLAKQLHDRNLQPKDIDAIFLSHIHLDHAGSAWCFAEQGSKIYLHPIGAKHLHDTSLLMESVKKIYRDKTSIMWGQVKNIPTSNMVIAADKQQFDIDGLAVTAHYTPGHASHHIVWQVDNCIFSGDALGCRVGSGPIIAPTPPPDINYQLWQNSLITIKSIPANKVYMTHFGVFNLNDSFYTETSKAIDFMENLGKMLKQKEYTLEDFVFHAPESIKNNYMQAFNIKDQWDLYDKMSPFWMSCQGALLKEIKDAKKAASK